MNILSHPEILPYLQRLEVPAKTLLLQEGQVSKKAFFIEKGCVRAWFNNDGIDFTIQFFFENEVVASLESFTTNTQSLFNIETIEPCIIHSITKEEAMQVLDQFPDMRKQMETVFLQRLFLYQKLFLSRIKDSPEKRYKELLANHPEIIQRVPQLYIASFLGITPVSLSRIRNRRIS